MKKLTKKQRNEVYKLALSYFVSPKTEWFWLPKSHDGNIKFMCWAIAEAVTELNLINTDSLAYNFDDTFIHIMLPDFYENKPNDTLDEECGLWWILNEDNRQKRIDYLEKMVELTSK